MNDEERESRPQRGRGRGYGGRTSRWHVNPKSNVDTQQNQSPSKTQDNQQKQTQNQSSPPPPSQQQQQQQQQSKRHEERSQNQRNQRNNYRRNQGKLPIMCMYFISESGCPQENCRYAHGDGELERIRNSRGRRNSENENYGDEQERDYYRGPPKPYRQGRRNDYRRDDRNRNQRNAPQTRDENKGRDGDDEVPERTPALPPDSISKASLQRIAQMVNCRHIQKGCQFLSSKADLPAHMEKCPFERCKDYLANGQIDPIIKYFKKQIRQRDILIADLRSQVANNFKEEEETFGLEEEHINLFKELVFSGAGALQITSTFSSRYPNCQWSVFFHHVSESDLSYVYDGYLQWVYKSRRYILIKLNEDE